MKVKKLLEEIERLKADNERLSKIVIDATKGIKSANDLAENYRRMFDQLFHVNEIKHDSFVKKDISDQCS